MRQIRLDTDIQPLSEFRSKTAHFIKQLNENRRPLVLTQHGKSIAVLLNVREYEKILEKDEIIDDIKKAESQIEGGLAISHNETVKKIKGK